MSDDGEGVTDSWGSGTSGGLRSARRRWVSTARAGVVLALGLVVLVPEGKGLTRESSPQEGGQESQQSSTDLIGAHDNTNFPLLGQHRTVECGDCHLKGVIEGTPRTCEHCHWVRRQDDRYRLRLGSHCRDCHTSQSWKKIKGGRWDHEAKTGFRLEGAHRSLECAGCHGTSGFTAVASDCSFCHMESFRKVKEPNHVAAGFPTTCETCHRSSTSWEQGVVFDHASFPLRGAHASAACEDCHAGKSFSGTSTACSACHMDDYNRADHRQKGFSTDCVSCHGSSATTWGNATLDHSRFPLKGKHQTAACSDCHGDGVYRGRPSRCGDCHLADYNRTNHREQGFSTDCESCHGTSATSWENATFNHDRFFRLQGAHRRLDCQACHQRGPKPPKNCFGCHAADYQGAKNPNHVQAGFPTRCENCHFPNHVSWSQAVFRHPFPIDRGPHRFDCSECHRSGNTRQFSCIHCHEHEKQQMDKKHREVGGYTYNSQACYSCHPNGKED